MRTDRLVTMANDVGRFFDTDPDKVEAAKNVATHLRRFWDPRMRREILAHYAQGGAGLDDVAKAAVGLLAESTKPAGAPGH